MSFFARNNSLALSETDSKHLKLPFANEKGASQLPVVSFLLGKIFLLSFSVVSLPPLRSKESPLDSTLKGDR